VKDIVSNGIVFITHASWPVPALTAGILWLGALSPAKGQDPGLRMIVATEVVCRAQPSRSAAPVRSYRLGDLLPAARTETGADGDTWYFDQWRVSGRSPSCWVYGPLTTEFVRANPEPALLASVDHILQRADRVTFEEYVEVDNLLSEDTYAPVVASSGPLQFGRLRIVERLVLQADGQSIDREPLKRAWILAHRDLLWHFEPGDQWYVRPDVYWSLYERHKEAPWAEDLAWAAAQLWVPSDECYADCVLEKVNQTFVQYWTRYPDGVAVKQALAQAIPMVKYSASIACHDKHVSYSVSRELLDQIRRSLAQVTASEKEQLLESLDHIQRKCLAVALRGEARPRPNRLISSGLANRTLSWRQSEAARRTRRLPPALFESTADGPAGSLRLRTRA
jgi:hypothetical protein